MIRFLLVLCSTYCLSAADPVMLSGDWVPSDPHQIFMKGNSAEHPNANLIFRIFVDSIDTPQPQPVKPASRKPKPDKN